MKGSMLMLLVLPLIIIACQSVQKQDQNSHSPAKGTTAPVVDSAVLAWIAQLPEYPLPYHLNTLALQYPDYNDLLPMEESLAETLLPSADTGQMYNGVAYLQKFDHFRVVVVMRTVVGSLFEVEDYYYLVTISAYGQVIDRIPFAANVVADQHYRVAGHYFSDGSITTEKYLYTFTDGSWERVDPPVKTVYYTIDTRGKIKEVHSEVQHDDKAAQKVTS